MTRPKSIVVTCWASGFAHSSSADLRWWKVCVLYRRPFSDSSDATWAMAAAGSGSSIRLALKYTAS
ncbi:hypothetical protein BJF90_18670 [Pseudonocardia sp. CNS-004]|nr:hypothetical protein BJF90_18670 [Pseudonocardia sp. CNS-004]